MEIFTKSKKFKKIIALAKPTWKFAIIGCACALIVMGLEMILPLIGKSLIDYTILHQPLPTFSYVSQNVQDLLHTLLSSSNHLIGLMVMLGLLIGIFTCLESFFIDKFQRYLVFNLKNNLFSHVIYFPFSFFKKQSSNYLVSRLTRDVDFLQYFLGSDVVQLLTSIIGIVFCVFCTVSLNAKLALGLLITIPLSFAFDYFCIIKVRRVMKEEREKEALLSQKMQEIFAGIDMVKVYQTELKESEDVKEKLWQLLQFKAKNSLLKIFSFQFSRGAHFAALIFVTVFSMILLKNQKLSIGDYLAFLTYTTLLSGFASSLTSFYYFWQPLFLSCDRICELLEQEKEKNDKNSEISLSTLEGEISFDQVGFRYEENSVFQKLDFTLPAKTITAILGVSGVGKSTLVGLLLKFFSPTEGEIYFDKKKLSEISANSLRQHIALVSQDLFLFNASVKENLSYGFTACDEEIFTAAKKAGIHEEILGFERGYDTIVGERGCKLSMGQRQRIALARALLKKAALLIFDEPTSALDKKSEENIFNLLKNLSVEKTVIVITHRPHFASLAHQVIHLEKNKCTFSKSYVGSEINLK